jgi:hypothetical protein
MMFASQFSTNIRDLLQDFSKVARKVVQSGKSIANRWDSRYSTMRDMPRRINQNAPENREPCSSRLGVTVMGDNTKVISGSERHVSKAKSPTSWSEHTSELASRPDVRDDALAEKLFLPSHLELKFAYTSMAEGVDIAFLHFSIAIRDDSFESPALPKRPCGKA